MAINQPTILSEELEISNDSGPEMPEPSRPRLNKILLIIALILVLVILSIAFFFIIKKYWPTSPPPAEKKSEITLSASSTVAASSSITLPNFNQAETTTPEIATSSFSSLAVEYLTFDSFYKAPDNKITPKINDYTLPLNIKIDVMNYYDISRKLDLDAGLDNLNNYGFAVVDNPWPQEAKDFYSAYGVLDNKQIPLLVTSDFLLYSYQNILKRTFKDIEENVFYDNLWDINYKLYTLAKNRYETRLAAIGDINDSILEGERLETAFFALALELLKPSTDQIAAKSAQGQNLFGADEAERFYFVAPPYLRDDVLAEAKLIREAKKDKTKSPILLYYRNYTEFTVPTDYRQNAKLNNFYLTTKWLNSVFPLNYRSSDCPGCLLDAADWRINLTAASRISQDFSSLPELKNKWARIYKIISFFKGLRADLDYVHYRDSLVSLFGEDYKIDTLFDDQNKQAAANLEKLRVKLSAYAFPAISGARTKSDPNFKSQAGFKMLAESYWPNDYIFSRLLTPAVGVYPATSTKPNNITACFDKDKKVYTRCGGLALDFVNLVYPIANYPYFAENTNYLNYDSSAGGLRQELDKGKVWHLNNYWTTLSTIKTFLEMDKNNLPLFARSVSWRDQSLRTAATAWINLQMPLEKFSSSQNSTGQSFNFSRENENSYIDPNLNLINELIANNNMLLQMFTALQLDTEVRWAWQDMNSFTQNLIDLRAIINKELTGESLSAADNQTIADFIRQFKTETSSTAEKQLYLALPAQKNGLQEDLSRLQFLVLIHREGDNKIFSVGPVWDYQESRY